MNIEPEKKRKRVSPVSTSDFMEESRLIWRRDWDSLRSDKSESREFWENFGCGVNLTHTIWMMMDSRELIPNNGMIHHLLWILSFMKIYGKERMMCHLNFIRNLKTIRKWMWLCIDFIVELESLVVSNLFFNLIIIHSFYLTFIFPWKILFEIRLEGDRANDCLMSVDGTEFRIAEHGLVFSSHKFKMKLGLRYEGAICILTGDIVWLNGPFPRGRWNDIKIFQNSLMSHLSVRERVEADDGYIGEIPQHFWCSVQNMF